MTTAEIEHILWNQLELLSAARRRGEVELLSSSIAAFLKATSKNLQQTISPAALRLHAEALYLVGISRGDTVDTQNLRNILRYYQRGLRISRETKDRRLISTGQLHIGNHLRIMGNLAPSYNILNSIEPPPVLCGRKELLLARTASQLGLREVFLRSLERCEEFLETGICGDTLPPIAMIEVGARGRLLLGDVDAALDTFDRARFEAQESKHLLWNVISEITRLEALLAAGEKDFVSAAIGKVTHDVFTFRLNRQYSRILTLASKLSMTHDDLRLAAAASKNNLAVASDLREKIKRLPLGQPAWREFEDLVRAVFELSLPSSLEVGMVQVRSADGLQRLDMAIFNHAEHGFWQSMRDRFGAEVIPVEVKNKKNLEPSDYNQLSAYLDSQKGRFGILVKRSDRSLRDIQASLRVLRKSEAIVVLGGKDLVLLLELATRAKAGTEVIERAWHETIARY